MRYQRERIHARISDRDRIVEHRTSDRATVRIRCVNDRDHLASVHAGTRLHEYVESDAWIDHVTHRAAATAQGDDPVADRAWCD
jgi:hypothetical protein